VQCGACAIAKLPESENGNIVVLMLVLVLMLSSCAWWADLAVMIQSSSIANSNSMRAQTSCGRLSKQAPAVLNRISKP
jgi:hypothetical protein